MKLYLLIALACLPRPALASPGGRAGTIFDFGASARALGLGGAYAALAQDDSAVYYNAAGLGHVGGRGLTLMEATLYGLNYNYLGYAQPAFGGGLGFALMRLGAGGLEGRDALNQPTGSFGYSETGVEAGYGLRGLWLGRLSAGVSAKLLERRLGPASNRLAGLDAGVRYLSALGGRRLHLAAVAQNALQAKMGSTEDRLPTALRLGAAWEALPNLYLSGDLASDSRYAFGTEYGWGPAAFRLGLLQQGLSFGLGLLVRERLQLDYAVYNDAALGVSNRVSLGWKLGSPKADPVKASGQDAWLDGRRALADRRYLSACRLMETALELEGAAAAEADVLLVRRLRELVDALRLQAKPARQEELVALGEPNELAAKAISLALAGSDAAALLFAQAASGSNPQEEALRALVTVLEGRAKRTAPADEILPPRDLVELKMAKALDLVYAMHFDAAVAQLEDVLVLAPDNALAWTRLGSASFALGLNEKAKSAYRRALALDPANRDVRDFMANKGWR